MEFWRKSFAFFSWDSKKRFGEVLYYYIFDIGVDSFDVEFVLDF